jgi:hypothetical protein
MKNDKCKNRQLQDEKKLLLLLNLSALIDYCLLEILTAA